MAIDIETKKLVIFDLDCTLAESKSVLTPQMSELLSKLLTKKKVAVISGGGYPQFENQLLRGMPTNTENYSNLYLLPTSGTRLYTWKGTWSEKYAEHLTPAEKEIIMSSLNSALKATSFTPPTQYYGQIIEDRGSQITFSALGQQAPLAEKQNWDPTREKREKIADILREKIPQFDIRIGGSTSIDITKRGINKAYGIKKLEEYLKIPIEEMVFVGDTLFQGGNDYPARASGVDCIPVKDPTDTAELIKSWVQ